MTRGPSDTLALSWPCATWHASVGHNKTRWCQLSPSVRKLSVWVSESAEADKGGISSPKVYLSCALQVVVILSLTLSCAGLLDLLDELTSGTLIMLRGQPLNPPQEAVAWADSEAELVPVEAWPVLGVPGASAETSLVCVQSCLWLWKLLCLCILD